MAKQHDGPSDLDDSPAKGLRRERPEREQRPSGSRSVALPRPTPIGALGGAALASVSSGQAAPPRIREDAGACGATGLGGSATAPVTDDELVATGASSLLIAASLSTPAISVTPPQDEVSLDHCGGSCATTLVPEADPLASSLELDASAAVMHVQSCEPVQKARPRSQRRSASALERERERAQGQPCPQTQPGRNIRQDHSPSLAAASNSSSLLSAVLSSSSPPGEGPGPEGKSMPVLSSGLRTLTLGAWTARSRTARTAGMHRNRQMLRQA